MDQTQIFCCNQMRFASIQCSKMWLRLGLRPGPRWGSFTTGASRLNFWVAPIPPPPLLHFPPFYFSFPPIFLSSPFPFLLSEVALKYTAMRSDGERCKLPPLDLKRSPTGKANLVHFSLKIWHLVLPILLIFLKLKEYTGNGLIGCAKCIVAQPTKILGGSTSVELIALPRPSCWF